MEHSTPSPKQVGSLSRLIFRFNLVLTAYATYQLCLVEYVWQALPALKQASYLHLPKFLNGQLFLAVLLILTSGLVYKEIRWREKPLLCAQLNVYGGALLVFGLQLVHHFLLEPLSAYCYYLARC